ncbi:TPA: hypothetical protein N0F65_010654 [Lagenidium giganteum]|uniref:Polyprotein n=1 Tax=Lagenidium giganteum TaxID=4803 RepID=A0AAV2Z5U7_9STRA|nr:TPA: hypothetical protein N0F65_010654 [Lagenidium giganteum]
MKRSDELLGQDNYFHRSFNMRMTLAKKGLLGHNEGMELETEEWRSNDMKAFAIIAQGVEVQHQSKIHNATSAKQAWEILREYYNKQNIHNRVALTRRLNDFRMDANVSIIEHLDKFDELMTAMETASMKRGRSCFCLEACQMNTTRSCRSSRTV